MSRISTNGGSAHKPFNANKRLLVLLVIFIILLGGLMAAYYFHIKNNEQNFRESQFQRLDSHFDIISKQLNNDIQGYNAQKNSALDSIDIELYKQLDGVEKKQRAIEVGPEKNQKEIKDLKKKKKNLKEAIGENDTKLKEHAISIEKSIEKEWKKPSKKLKLGEDFDQYILIIADTLKTDTISIHKSSLKGLVIPPDSIFKTNYLNIGISMPIPEEEMEYQLFGKAYNYETSLNENVTFKIKIIGLVKADRYHESTRKLDPWIIALLTTFLLLVLFGLPYFKMLFIAEDERLSSADVISSGISVLIGAPIMVVIFLAIMYDYYQHTYIIPDHLKVTSSKIAANFEEENRVNVDLLASLDLKKEEARVDSLNNLNNKKKVAEVYTKRNETDCVPTILLAKPHKKRQIDDSDKEPCILLSGAKVDLMENFKFIMKLDATGKAKFHIALINRSDVQRIVSLAGRPYFKDLEDRKNIWVSSNKTEYTMRPVVSIEDGTEEAVYILRDRLDTLKTSYRAGASQLKSLHDPILPFGYQFAIIDEEGDVWFHSEEGRSTLENFFTVSKQFGPIQAALLGRVSARGHVNYRGDEKLFSATPIANTNLSVITLYDIALMRARVSEILTLASFAIILSLFILLIITVLSLIIRNPKIGLYKYNQFLFEFLTPKKNKREAYILLSMLFSTILIISIAVGTYAVLDASKVYLISLLMGAWTYLTVYYTLHSDRNNRAIKFRVRDLLLLVMILFLNALMFKINGDDSWFLATFMLVQACFIFFIVRGQFYDVPDKIKDCCEYKIFKGHIAYRYWYSTFLFSWLLLAAVYPAYLIFEKAEDLNDAIWLKADYIFMAKKYMENEKKLIEHLPQYDDLKSNYKTLYQNHQKKRAIYR